MSKEDLIELISRRFEISFQQAVEYIDILSLTDEGIDSLIYICQGFGKSRTSPSRPNPRPCN